MNDSARDLPFYVRERIASDPNSDETELIDLASDRESMIRLQVAMNSSSSTNVLKAFTLENDKHVISALIKREHLPAKALESISYSIMKAIDELLKEGHTDDDLILDAYICSNTVSHLNATESMLKEASRHPLPLIRLGAISNPHLSSQTLYEMILEERNLTVMRGILSHKNSLPAAVRFLTELKVDCSGLPETYIYQLLWLTLPAMD